MFTLTRLLATLGALVVVPTIAYVFGETVDTPPPAQPPAQVQQQMPPSAPSGTMNGGMPGFGGGQGQSQGGPNNGQFPGFPPQGQMGGPGMMNGNSADAGGSEEFQGNDNGRRMPPMKGGFPNGGFGQGQGMMGGSQGMNGGTRGNGIPGMQGGLGGGNQGMMGQAQSQPGQPPMMSPQGQPGGEGAGQGTDTNAQSEQQQAQMDAQQQQQEERQLGMIKQGVSRANQPLKMMQAQIQRLQAQKITVPTEITDFVGKMSAAIEAVKGAQTLDDAQTAMSDLQDGQQDFQDYFQTLQQLKNWKQIQSQAARQIKQFQSMLKRYQASAKRKSSLDISDQLNQLSDLVIGLQATLDKANSLMANGQASDAMDTMQTDFFSTIDDSQDLQQTLQALVNISAYVRSVPRQVKLFTSQVNALKRKGVDTSSADTLLEQLNSKIAEIKTLAAAKPVDADALTTAVEDDSTLIEQLNSTIDDLSGSTSATDQLFQVNPQSVPSFQIPTSGAPQQ